MIRLFTVPTPFLSQEIIPIPTYSHSYHSHSIFPRCRYFQFLPSHTYQSQRNILSDVICKYVYINMNCQVTPLSLFYSFITAHLLVNKHQFIIFIHCHQLQFNWEFFTRMKYAIPNGIIPISHYYSRAHKQPQIYSMVMGFTWIFPLQYTSLIQ